MYNQEDIDFLNTLKVHDALIKHSLKVSEVALKLALAFKEKGFEIDLDLVKKGALLHDIGRTKTNSVRHGYEGGQILRSLGFDERIARIAERHVGGGLSKEETENLKLPDGVYTPETIEEKIVCFADKLVEVDTLIPLQITLDKFEKELGKTSEAIQRLLNLKNEIAKLFGSDPEDFILKSLDFV